MPNKEIRNYIRDAEVKMWQVAKALHVSDMTLYRWLRDDLSAERKEAIYKAVQAVKDSK